MRPSEPPTEADHAQATATAHLLTELIGEYNSRLAALHADAAQAASTGTLQAARAIHAKSLHVRHALEQLQAMQRRLTHRFFPATGTATAAPPA